MTHEQIINTLLVFAICLAVFAVIREVICWYFKINKRVELQEKILAELVKVNKSNNLVVSGGGINSPSTITDTDEPILNAYSKGL